MRWLSYWLGWSVIRVILWILFGLKVTGKENVPRKGAFILAVNHQSYTDPPMIGAAVPRVMHFFAKKELFENRIFGAIISWCNAIPVKRGTYDPKSISRALQALGRGGALMLFPEGTRGDGCNFLPPKPGIGLIAKRAKVPIVPAYAEGTSRLKEAFLSRKRLRVILGKPLLPDDIDRFADDKGGYLALAETVMARIRRLKEGIKGNPGQDNIRPTN